MKDEKGRQIIVEAALAFTTGTPAEASEYERCLLEKYVQGVLNIEEVIILVEAKAQVSSA